MPLAARGGAGTIRALLCGYSRFTRLALALGLLAAPAAPGQEADRPAPGAPAEAPAGAPGAAPGPLPRIRANRFPDRGWIPEATLEAQLGLFPGDPYRVEELGNALARLLAFRFVERGGAPIVQVVENGAVDLEWPIVPRLLVRSFRLQSHRDLGRPALDLRELRGKLRTRAGEPLVRDDLEADRLEVLDRHVEEGYLFCEVTVEERPAGSGAADLVLAIQEGPHVSIGSIEFQGNSAVPRRHLLAAMETRPRVFFGLFHQGNFVPERFERDLEGIRRLYRDRGYLEVAAAPKPPEFNAGLSRMDLTVLIEEGPRYDLEGLLIEGNGPGVPVELLWGEVRSRPGGPYDGALLEEDRRRILRWYEQHYDLVPRVEVIQRFGEDPAGRGVTAVFKIDETQHVLAGRVNISGNLRTRDRVIRSTLSAIPGSPLTETALRDAAGRLAALGYFVPEKIMITATPAGMAPVEVKVEERRTGLIEAGGGASTGEGEIAYVGITQTNFDLFALPGPNRSWKDAFSGGGQILHFEIAPGTEQSELLLRFEEPYLYNSRHALSVLAATQLYERFRYDETRVRGEVGVRRFWDDARRVSTGLTYVLEDVGISSVSSHAPADVQEVRGHTFLAYPSLRLGYSDLGGDRRSGPLGFRADLRGDAAAEATGSEASFLRTIVSAELFQPVSAALNRLLPGDPLSEAPGHEHVLRLGARFGWLGGMEGDDPPIYERFFIGGPRSVRGFDYRGLGEEEAGVKLGGEAFYYGTVEYSLPLVIPEVRGVILFDFADIEPEFSSLSARRIRTAAGGGLRLRPSWGRQFIPIDLYYVEALSSERGDDVRAFTFTLGINF